MSETDALTEVSGSVLATRARALRLAIRKGREERDQALANVAPRSAEFKAADEACEASRERLAGALERYNAAIVAVHELTLNVWRLEWELNRLEADPAAS